MAKIILREGTNWMVERMTRAKAIRLKCLDCCCNQPAEVRRCHLKDCTLWRFRMGTEEKDDLYLDAHRKPKSSGSAEKTA